MIAGLLLTMSGVLFALLSPPAAAGNAYGASQAAGLTALTVIVGLILLAVVVARFRSKKEQGNDSDHPCHNLPSTATETEFRPESEKELFDEQALLREVERCLALSRREGRELSLLAVAIDELPVDDAEVSAQVEPLRRSLEGLSHSRGATLLRVENPEFMVLATDLLADEALELGKALTRAVFDLGIPNRAAPGGTLTASVGAVLGDPGANHQAANYLEAARSALSRARNRGGNRVESETL